MKNNVNTNFAKIVCASPSSRADSFLSDHFGRSRSYFASLIEGGHVTINGRIPKKSDSVKPGDEIVVSFPVEPAPDITPKEMDFDVLVDNRRYAIINKPAGVTVHPAPGHYDDSLVNGLLHRFNIEDDPDGFRPGIVHRLDKDTSGLLLIAKDRDAREALSALFSSREIKKYYMALASGKPKFTFTSIDAPIARDRLHRKRMCVDPSGRNAKTDVTVKEVFKNAFLADILLHTGRTHQIRVHMKHIKHPLLGDELYGGKGCAALFHRQALHAYRIAFSDPFTGEDVDISIPLPEDMLSLIKRIDR